MKALSIRQPWAWAILHAGKDVENRSWYTGFRGRFLIHASKGMTNAEFEDALETVSVIAPDALPFPPRKSLDRGGIVGIATVANCTARPDSRWFFGQFGIVLADVKPLPFIPCRGALGFFAPPLGVVERALAFANEEAAP